MNTERNFKKSLKLGIALFTLGFLGVLSTLTIEVPLPQEIQGELLNMFSPTQLKLLTLINPTIMLLFATIVGCMLHFRVDLKVPILDRLVNGVKMPYTITSILKAGIVGGLLCGGLLSFISWASASIIPEELANIKTSPWARFLYGGITEEILMRFGTMTFFIAALFFISKTQQPWIYKMGIALSALMFGVGHLPVVWMYTSNPNTALIAYIVVANSLGGLIFGTLYWKKGLESAMIAHIVTHLVFITVEALNNT